MLGPGDSFNIPFTTTSPSTGGSEDPDALPVAFVSHNGVVDGAVTVTVTKIESGVYEADGTVPTSGYAEGDRFNIYIRATVEGIFGKSPIASYKLHTDWGGKLTPTQAGDLLIDVGAVTAGNVNESVDHSATTFLSPLDGTTQRITSAQTPTTRTVTRHDS